MTEPSLLERAHEWSSPLAKDFKLVFLICYMLVNFFFAFMATPSVLHWTNTDWRMANEEVGSREKAIQEATDRLLQLELELVASDPSTPLARPEPYDLIEPSSGGEANQEAPKTTTVYDGPDYKRENEMYTRVRQWERRIASTEVALSSSLDSRENAAKKSRDAYLAIRAFALGAIGAFFILVAGYVRSTMPLESIYAKNLGATIASTFVGGIVAIVAFSLLHTKQLSIFPVSESPSATASDPDPWRVALLCLVAGAYADKLVDAMSQWVKRYLDQQVESGNKTS